MAHIIGTRDQPSKRVATSGGRKSLFAIQSESRADPLTVEEKHGGLDAVSPVARRDGMITSMATADLLARIAAEPGKMGGKPVIRGRRVTPAMVLTMLAAGASREAVLDAYPVLEPDDIDACLLYAARLTDQVAGIAAE